MVFEGCLLRSSAAISERVPKRRPVPRRVLKWCRSPLGSIQVVSTMVQKWEGQGSTALKKYGLLYTVMGVHWDHSMEIDVSAFAFP